MPANSQNFLRRDQPCLPFVLVPTCSNCISSNRAIGGLVDNCMVPFCGPKLNQCPCCFPATSRYSAFSNLESSKKNSCCLYLRHIDIIVITRLYCDFKRYLHHIHCFIMFFQCGGHTSHACQVLRVQTIYIPCHRHVVTLKSISDGHASSQL